MPKNVKTRIKIEPYYLMGMLGLGLMAAAVLIALVGVFTLPSYVWGWPAGILWSAGWLCCLLAGPVAYFFLKRGR